MTDKPNHNTEPDRLISRPEMLLIARKYNIFVTKSTIHRWSEEEELFPPIEGLDGRARLYSERKFIAFIKQRLRKVQMQN